MEKIRQMIEDRQYVNVNNGSYWGGADVIISDNDTPEIRNWVNSSSAHIAVITQSASALIWLVEQLKPIAKIDYMTKFDYYATIANTAKRFVASNDDDTQALLLAVLNSVREYL